MAEGRGGALDPLLQTPELLKPLCALHLHTPGALLWGL